MFSINKKYNVINCVLKVIIFTVLATCIGLIFKKFSLHETNVVMVYILAVLLISRYTSGYIYGIVATLVCTVTFNYFFTKPMYKFEVYDTYYIITFLVMIFTSITTSAITTLAMENELEARSREKETLALYTLTDSYTDVKEISDIVGITVKTISSIFSCNIACLCFNDVGFPENSFIQQKDSDTQVRRMVKNPIEIKHNIETLKSLYYMDDEFCNWPIYGSNSTLGIIRFPIERCLIMTDDEKRFLRTIIDSMALAMDRYRSMKKILKSEQEFEQERFRSNLLRAISHDLRTPLSGIMGTSEMIRDMVDINSSVYKMADDICRDAKWLHSLMENILSLTKLQDGKMKIEKNFEAVEEIIESAVTSIEKLHPDVDINIEIPDKLILVPVNASLIGQLLYNLLENAIKHTSSDREIGIMVEESTSSKKEIRFTVYDNGEGINKKDICHIFETFYTTNKNEVDFKNGVGLGLAICKSIVNAHNGEIYAKNRDDKNGAEFIFTLPLELKDDIN